MKWSADAIDAIYEQTDELNDYYKAGGNHKLQLMLIIYCKNSAEQHVAGYSWRHRSRFRKPILSITAAYGTWDPEQTVVDRSKTLFLMDSPPVVLQETMVMNIQ